MEIRPKGISTLIPQSQKYRQAALQQSRVELERLDTVKIDNMLVEWGKKEEEEAVINRNVSILFYNITIECCGII